jgi:hypothetical protein
MSSAEPLQSDLSRESKRLAQRLVRCLSGATFEMETLVRLAGIEATRSIETAAVECRARPRMLLNPDFVAEHCRRDEHLFLLVMHELWHVILAHTTLYPRATVAQNIAFDAIINAGLARQFQGPSHRGFFEGLYDADSFPELLLRPPVGWPASPVYPRDKPAGLWRLMTRLYPPTGSTDPMPLYCELLELLESAGNEGTLAGAADELGERLLGSHGEALAGGEGEVLDDEVFGEMVRRMVASWPPPPLPLAGLDAGRAPHDWVGALRPAAAPVKRAFARVLRRAIGPRPGALAKRSRASAVLPVGRGVLPNATDRLVPARRLLGLPATLYEQVAVQRERRIEPMFRAHVYVDVSGSMFELLPHVAGLLAPYVASGEAQVFQFSTVVEPLALADLRAGRLRTTGGTSIHCVLDHALAYPRLRRVLVLTDGYVGGARGDQSDALRERGIRIHVVLPSESAYRIDLEPIAASITVLPPLRAAGQPWRI